MLLGMITLDWSQVGGSGLQVKEILAFNRESPFAIYFLCNDISPKLLTAELTRILENTIAMNNEMQRGATEQGDGDEEEETLQAVPEMVL